MHTSLPMRHIRSLWGGHVEIVIKAPPGLAQRALAAAFETLSQIHRLSDFHDEQSDISRINLVAHKRPVSISPQTMTALCFARQLTRQSEGLFDLTAGGRLVREGRLPDHGFSDLYARGCDALLLLPRLRVRLKRPVVLTLDAIIKGYALDQAVRTLLSHGVASGLVNAGGELRLFGKVEERIQLREANGGCTSLGAWSNAALSTTARSLALESPARTPSCLMESGGCDGAACPHFMQCPHAWTTVVAKEAWRACGLNAVAHNIPLKERAARIAKLGGRLISEGDVLSPKSITQGAMI
ncbi:MAG: FAD:protein FMN transferase [Pseudomonadota bacterium]